MTGGIFCGSGQVPDLSEGGTQWGSDMAASALRCERRLAERVGFEPTGRC